MTLRIKWQKSRDKRYQVVYALQDGKETYLGTEKTLIEMKKQSDLIKGKGDLFNE